MASKNTQYNAYIVSDSLPQNNFGNVGLRPQMTRPAWGQPMRWIQGLILCLWWAAVPGLAGAEVTMEARLGLQETVRLEKWNQIIVRLHNNGPPVTGMLGVRVWRGSEMRGDLHVTSFTQPVSLSHRARKRFAFTVPITSISRPVEVFLRRGEEVLQQQSLDLRTALSAEQVILGLTRDLSLDFLATLLPTHTRIVYLPQDELPQHWYGYDSVSAVVLKGLSLQSLSESQAKSLRQWIAGGGTLVVASDSRYALLTEPRLRALLPVRVLGVEQRDGLPELAAHYGVPLKPAPLIAMRARLTQGEVLIGSADRPLMAQRAFGNGRVVFLAVDYATQPLAGWRGNQALWHDMLQPAERIDFSRVFAELGLLDERHPAVEILSRPVLLYPSHVALGVLLSVYCGALGGLFWIIKRQRLRPAATGLVVTLLLLAFTAAGYSLLAQHNLHRSALAFDLTTLEVLPGTGYSRLRGAVGVFSVHGGRYTLPLQHPETMLRHTFTRGAGPAGEALEVGADESTAIRHIDLGPWTLRAFSLEGMAPAPIQVRAERQAGSLSVRVANPGSLPLHAAAIMHRGNPSPLGSIAPGQTVSVVLPDAPQRPEPPHERLWQTVFAHSPLSGSRRLAYMQEVLLRHYFNDRRLADHDAPFLSGWLLAPGTVQPNSGAPPTWGLTLVVSPLTPSDSFAAAP